MEKLKSFIEKNTKDHLILDGLIPTISLGIVQEELILYNFKIDQYPALFQKFFDLTNKTITDNYLISELSHGQRLVLSFILAINSNADKIILRNFFTSISSNIQDKMNILIQEKNATGKEITIINE